MTLPNIDVEYLVDFLCRLLNTPSPTGFAGQAIALTEAELGQFSALKLRRNRKGALIAVWPGSGGSAAKAALRKAAAVAALKATMPAG